MYGEFQRILVPLDGSRLAEVVLPYVVDFASSIHASIILLHVLERDAPTEIHGERHLTRVPEAEEYLDRLAAECRAKHVTCSRHVHSPGVRGVAAAIAAHAEELGADLIAMTTHGSGGLRDFFLGSIAQQTLAQGSTSVLLVRPDAAERTTALTGGMIIVAIDLAAHGLPPLQAVQGLAMRFGARLHLVTVVPDQASLPLEQRSSARFAPHAASAFLDLEARDAGRLLRQAGERLEADGLQVSMEVRRGDPRSEVSRAVRERKADLLVVATHGRAGLEGLLSGSFAAGIMADTSIPLLLLRLPNN